MRRRKVVKTMGIYKLFGRMPIPLLVYMNVIVLSALIALAGWVFLGWPVLIVQAISWGGLILASVGIMLYVVLIDSKKRWPRLSALERFLRVITFTH